MGKERSGEESRLDCLVDRVSTRNGMRGVEWIRIVHQSWSIVRGGRAEVTQQHLLLPLSPYSLLPWTHRSDYCH